MKLPKGIKHGGRCLTCRKWIVAATSAEWVEEGQGTMPTVRFGLSVPGSASWLHP